MKGANNMNLTEYAKQELDRVLEKSKGVDGYDEQVVINADILAVVELCGSRGHSGFSAGYALGIIKRLLDYKPIGALTGEDSEWFEEAHGTQQNKRCFSVFRNNHDNATARYNGARVYSDNGGITWYSKGGMAGADNILFPFKVPDKPEKVYLEETGERVISGNAVTLLHNKKRKEFDERGK